MQSSVLLATVSAASSRTSIGYDLGDYLYYSVHAVISGADIAGTLVLQASNDNSNWITVLNSSQSITSSADYMYEFCQAAYRYVRGVWTASSGTGNITLTIVTKEPFVKSLT